MVSMDEYMSNLHHFAVTYLVRNSADPQFVSTESHHQRKVKVEEKKCRSIPHTSIRVRKVQNR
jgi:hypothetical protein